MSPLWRDRFIAVLCPDRVAIVRRRGGRNRGLELHADAPCAAPTAQAACEALAGLLARTGSGKGDLSIVLSSHFVRYLLVPWRDEVRSPAELAAFAGICCDQGFGAEPAGRMVLISPEKTSAARIAAAIDMPLLAALRKSVEGSRMRLTSIQPYLVTAFNAMRHSLGRRDFLFLVAEPRRSCLLMCTGGNWSSVRASSAADQPQALADLIEREAQLIGLGDEAMPPIYVHAPGQADLRVPACRGVVPQSVGVRTSILVTSAADPLLAMAMTVA